MDPIQKYYVQFFKKKYYTFHNGSKRKVCIDCSEAEEIGQHAYPYRETGNNGINITQNT